jgi:hypothetical protein
MSYEKNQKVVVAVDFDGTLFEEGKFPEVGKPIRKHIKLIQKLHDLGYTIVIWTLRTEEKGTAKAAKDAMDLENVPYHFFNETPTLVQDQWGDQRKIGCHYFIDDRNAGGIPPPDQILRELRNLSNRMARTPYVKKYPRTYDEVYTPWVKAEKEYFKVKDCHKMPECAPAVDKATRAERVKDAWMRSNYSLCNECGSAVSDSLSKCWMCGVEMLK